MAASETKLSIVIAAIDKATAPIRAVSNRLDALTKPRGGSGIGNALGVGGVIEAFSSLGGVITDVLSKVAAVGGAIAGMAAIAVAGLFHLIGEFDDLGDKAERFGVSVDFLAQMEFAAEKAGAKVEDLDGAISTFNVNMGKLRANGGKMLKFLSVVSPALVTQLKATKNSSQAFDLIAGAMAKIEDPAKRAAFATATLGTDALAPLFAKGPKGIKDLRDRFAELAGSQQDAADKAGATDDAMHDFKASVTGVKAALVSGLAPALTMLVQKLTAFLSGHRAEIAEWVANFGAQLPGAARAFVDALQRIWEKAAPVLEALGKLIVAAAELVAGWVNVAQFFVDTWDAIKEKFGWAADAIAVVMLPFIAIPLEIISHWDDIKDFFSGVWDAVTSVFQKAWDFIKGIVDKIVGAVHTIVDGAETIGRALGFGGGNGNVTKSAFDTFRGINAQAGFAGKVQDAAAQGFGQRIAGVFAPQVLAAPPQESKITVNFVDAPRGTRVATDPSSSAAIDFTLGYQAFFGGGS